MPDTRIPTSFAMSSNGKSIYRIVVTPELQNSLDEMFHTQLKDFRDPEDEEVRYVAGFGPDEAQVCYIDHFTVPDAIRAAIRNPLSCQPLNLRDATLARLSAIFTGGLESDDSVTLQAFDRRQLLTTSRFSMILTGDTFRRLEEPGLILGTEVAAHVVGSKLYFRSFNSAKRIFDLSRFYREASDKDLRRFSRLEGVDLPDADAFVQTSDSWTRRKIASILDSRVLQDGRPRHIAQVARGFDLAIPVRKVHGRDVVVFPSEKRALKDLLRFLDEDYYSSPLTGTQFVSNSKHRLEKRPKTRRPRRG